jgi:hypothetical protein
MVKIKISLIFFLIVVAQFCIGKDNEIIKNNQYELVLLENNSVEVIVDGVPLQILSDEFTVMYSPIHLGFAFNRVGEFDVAYPTPFPDAEQRALRWTQYSDALDKIVPKLNSIQVQSRGELMATYPMNSKDQWIFIDSQGDTIKEMDGLNIQQTLNPFLAGKRTDIKAIKSSVKNRTIIWYFSEQTNFNLSAEIFLPEGSGDPQISYQLNVKKNGYYSVAYNGAPILNSDETLPIPQLTAGRGFKESNIVKTEAYLGLPRVHIATSKLNSALVIDPKETPFRLVKDNCGVQTYVLGSESNSRFGMMIEKIDQGVRPVALTPIMCGYQSRMLKGDNYAFTLRYVLRPGSWQDTYRHIAQEIYNFRDMRDNSGTGSLNNTLENIMDYLSDRDGINFAMWHAEQKYYNYWSDRSGNFKPFSPMFTLAAAIMTDDEDFYKKHALPIIEFALSRKENTFQPYDNINTIMAQWNRNIGFPYPDVVQLAELHGMFQKRTYALKQYVEKKGFRDDDFIHQLTSYRFNGNKSHLNKAIDLADKEADLGDEKTGDSWSGGNFSNYMEIYEETREDIYLEALSKGAYSRLYRYNLFPVVPDSIIIIDEGNKVPIHGHAYQRHRDWGFSPPKNLYKPEQKVPAWRASLIGTQWDVYRGGQWPWVHGQLMRAATHAEDQFIRDMQRWAMVGRYANYPGDFRYIKHSLVAELPDVPMHNIYETNFSTFNPGHAVEWIGAVMDFLVSDCFNRSEMNIDFPSRCMYGSAFRVKTYGDRPGKFYDEEDVRLWLPRKLVESDNKQVDYLAGYGNGKLYIVFWNQSFNDEQVNVDFNPDLVSYSGRHKARFWRDNEDNGNKSVSDNKLGFKISAKGIIAYAIENVEVKTGLHAKIFDPKTIILGEKSIITGVDTPFGKIHGMLITMGRGLTTSYIYTEAFPENIISARLKYRQTKGEWQEAIDMIFPFEFTTQIDEDAGDFEFIFEVENAQQIIQKSDLLKLKL